MRKKQGQKEKQILLFDQFCKITPVPEKGPGLSFLYETWLGRICLKLLTKRSLSEAVGHYMDQSGSRWIVPWFIKRCGIDMSEFQDADPKAYASFNDFFTRKVKPELRPITYEETELASPCDGLLRVYPVKEGCVIPVKESHYTLSRLLRDPELAARYQDGYCLVFRLCVNHYHRYHYPDSGVQKKNVAIDGVLHTVQPIALAKRPVFVENSREYTVLETEHFGPVVQMEVGALLVGRIANLHEDYHFRRGEEKGCFQYGGSTVILLVEKDQMILPADLLKATEKGYETHVKMGQTIGRKI